MIPLLTAAEAQAVDREAQDAFGIPELVLMERVALEIHADLTARSAPQAAWTILAGRGNNGGDALALARIAYLQGRPVRVFALDGKPSSANEAQRRILSSIGLAIEPLSLAAIEQVIQALDSSSLCLDGLLGIGFQPPLRPELTALIPALNSAMANRSGFLRAAIDVPSGVADGPGAEPVLAADLTYCAGFPKQALFGPGHRRQAGRILTVPAGFPGERPGSAKAFSSVAIVNHGDLEAGLPLIDVLGHKYQRGLVVVRGGAVGLIGAPVLAAQAAARLAGLVRLAVDDSIRPAIAERVLGPMVETVGADAYRKASAVVLGPGWGLAAGRHSELAGLWATDLPLVVDADALTILAAWRDFPERSAPIILTPHTGEMARLAGCSAAEVNADPFGFSLHVAKRYRAVVVLKGPSTIVTRPEEPTETSSPRQVVVDDPNAALAQGGSGDVLAGLIGALLAQGRPDFEAAWTGVALHQAAARRLVAEQGWFAIESLPEALGRAYQELRPARWPQGKGAGHV